VTATRSERAFAAVQQELDVERAAVLGRTGRRLEEALAACVAIGRRLDATTDEDARTELLAEYRSARALSEEWRWRLHVQREAIGLTEHRWVDRVHPPPPPR
jgi:hypothetical protein